MVWPGFGKNACCQWVAVNGSTTSADKLETLTAKDIKPFLIDLSADDAAYDPSFLLAMYWLSAIPPKSRSGEGAEYVPKLQRVINAINQHGVSKGNPY
jgi:hypothetical protein